MTEWSAYKGHWQALKHMYTYTEVSDYFLEEIESPSNISGQYATRRQYAATIYNAISSI